MTLAYIYAYSVSLMRVLFARNKRLRYALSREILSSSDTQRIQLLFFRVQHVASSRYIF